MKTIISKIKLTFFVLSFTYFTSQFYAQTLTAANCAPLPGDTIEYVRCNYIDPGTSSGAGQIWDLTTLSPNSLPWTNIYAVPSSTPAGSFNARYYANLCANQTVFFKSDSLGIYDLGDIGKGTRTLEINKSPKNIILKFPFHLTDTGQTKAVYLEESYLINNYTSISGNATGTLITPYGIYTNTLRVYRFSQIISQTLNSSTAKTHEKVTRYYDWYSPGIHGPILSIASCTTTLYQQLPVITQWAEVFKDTGEILTQVGIKGYTQSGFYGFHFQNPSLDQLNLVITESGNSNYTLQIIDFSGKELLKDTFSEKSHSIDLSSISAGIYLLQIKKENGSFGREKLIIEK